MPPFTFTRTRPSRFKRRTAIVTAGGDTESQCASVAEMTLSPSLSVSKEDYLKAILEAESEGESVISATLAHWLSVSPPAVTMVVRRLKREGLGFVMVKGGIRLTAAGRKIAGKLALRHHLIERMLAEIFGMEWYKVHDEAERMEHAVSPDFEAKLL